MTEKYAVYLAGKRGKKLYYCPLSLDGHYALKENLGEAQLWDHYESAQSFRFNVTNNVGNIQKVQIKRKRVKIPEYDDESSESEDSEEL